jgi:hypothetical protein
MLESVKAEIVTDASGNATVYLEHGRNRNPSGLLMMIKYDPGTIETGADIVITGEVSGVPIVTLTNAGTDPKFLYPRARLSETSDGSEASTGTEIIPIKNESIKVVVTQGGDTKTGSIEAVLLTDSPY